MFESTDLLTYGWFGAVCAVIAAKWASELGFSQISQLLWAILAFVFSPLALAALYVRHLHQRKAQGLPGANWA